MGMGWVCLRFDFAQPKIWASLISLPVPESLEWVIMKVVQKFDPLIESFPPSALDPKRGLLQSKLPQTFTTWEMMKLYIYKTRAVIITGSYTQLATFQPLQKKCRNTITFLDQGLRQAAAWEKKQKQNWCCHHFELLTETKNPERLNAFTTKLKKLIRDASFWNKFSRRNCPNHLNTLYAGKYKKSRYQHPYKWEIRHSILLQTKSQLYLLGVIQYFWISFDGHINYMWPFCYFPLFFSAGKTS